MKASGICSTTCRPCGHFDAEVDIRKENDAKTLRVIYQIDPGPLHKLVLVEITGNKEFLDTRGYALTCKFNRPTVS